MVKPLKLNDCFGQCAILPERASVPGIATGGQVAFIPAAIYISRT
jgi:hypothetical protein